jgi:FtsP/CotA-like multicopper oxidase with cupredoxin domain
MLTSRRVRPRSSAKTWAEAAPKVRSDRAPTEPPPGRPQRVRFSGVVTPPRAGTFMYHSHFDEFGQIGSGLYGSIVVVDRDQVYDGDTDRVMLFSDDGPTTNVIFGPFPKALLNGQSEPQPIELLAGVTYRFRLINIRTDYPASVAILEAGKPVEWRVVAKDGADLPPSQSKSRPAELTFAAGESYDVVFAPRAWGNLTLRFGAPKTGPIPAQATNVKVHVR